MMPFGMPFSEFRVRLFTAVPAVLKMEVLTAACAELNVKLLASLQSSR